MDTPECRLKLPNDIDYYSISYSYYLEYEVEGKNYKSVYTSSSKKYESEAAAQPDHKEGDYLTIYYNVEDPSDIRVSFIGVSSNLLYIFFACNLFICLIVFLVNYRLYRKAKQILN